jgi:hypothetical protein
MNLALVLIVDMIGFKVHWILVVPEELEIDPVDDLYIGLAPTWTRDVWDRMDYDLIRRLKNRRSHLSLVDFLKVLHIADLAWLGHTSARTESLPTVVSNCVRGVFSEAAEYQIAADQCPCSALSCIAVDNNDILRIAWTTYSSFNTQNLSILLSRYSCIFWQASKSTCSAGEWWSSHGNDSTRLPTASNF